MDQTERSTVEKFKLEQEMQVLQQVRGLQIVLGLAAPALSQPGKMYIAEQLIKAAQALTSGMEVTPDANEGG